MYKDWSHGVICLEHKKGDSSICSNYRGNTLLKKTYKSFCALLCNKFTCGPIIAINLGDLQNGFRRYRSTTYNTPVVKNVYEKCHEYSIII